MRKTVIQYFYLQDTLGHLDSGCPRLFCCISKFCLAILSVYKGNLMSRTHHSLHMGRWLYFHTDDGSENVLTISSTGSWIHLVEMVFLFWFGKTQEMAEHNQSAHEKKTHPLQRCTNYFVEDRSYFLRLANPVFYHRVAKASRKYVIINDKYCQLIVILSIQRAGSTTATRIAWLPRKQVRPWTRLIDYWII